MTTTWTERTPTTTTWTARQWLSSFITLITGKFTDWLDYILTDWVENALIVNDYTWAVEDNWTIWTPRAVI
jgi:hypothetical protein